MASVTPQKSRAARQQLPQWLAPFDDDRGLVWRGYNYAKRFDPARTARFLRAYRIGPTFTKPIFVIGAPRSGTTLTFEILSQHPDLASLGHEGHDMYRRFHHPRKTNWDSDVIDPTRAAPAAERRFIEAFIRARTSNKAGAARFVEKTVDTTLRIEYILKLFPDAQFIAIHRNPCEVVNSIIKGWRDPDSRFRAYFVPDELNIPGYDHKRQWCFTLIPGWRELTSQTIPEIAFRQWSAYVDGIANARKRLKTDQLTELRMSQLHEDAEAAISEIAARHTLMLTPATLDKMLQRASIRVNAFSNSAPSDWKKNNRDEITSLLPRISERASEVGFYVDAKTGDASPAPFS